MAILRIVHSGDPDDAVLNKPAMRVREFGPTLHKLLDDMVETLRAAPGVGLAAPQVGVGQRVLVIEYPEDEEDPENSTRLFEVINPEIIKDKGEEEGQEGCLSMPGLAADVTRATYTLIRYQDRHGKEIRYKAYGWLARIFQHEIDHLHGVLMSDRATQLYQVEEGEDGEFELVPIEQSVIATRTTRPSN